MNFPNEKQEKRKGESDKEKDSIMVVEKDTVWGREAERIQKRESEWDEGDRERKRKRGGKRKIVRVKREREDSWYVDD